MSYKQLINFISHVYASLKFKEWLSCSPKPSSLLLWKYFKFICISSLGGRNWCYIFDHYPYCEKRNFVEFIYPKKVEEEKVMQCIRGKKSSFWWQSVLSPRISTNYELRLKGAKVWTITLRIVITTWGDEHICRRGSYHGSILQWT